jgi:hypothetical protein
MAARPPAYSGAQSEKRVRRETTCVSHRCTKFAEGLGKVLGILGIRISFPFFSGTLIKEFHRISTMMNVVAAHFEDLGKSMIVERAGVRSSRLHAEIAVCFPPPPQAHLLERCASTTAT